MAAITLSDVFKKYEGFYDPKIMVYLGGNNPEEKKKLNIKVVDIVVELTSDLKASIATFTLINAYNSSSGRFDTASLKKFISIGTDVNIYMGHSSKVGQVFQGYIAGVDFLYDIDVAGDAGIRITALDVKGIMMANSYSKRLKANYYSDAVKELLDQAPYQTLQNNGVIQSITINDTPDKPQGGAGGGATPPDIRIEMVGESDYDFVVKAAKKFNFEFFSIAGHVVFRKAKQNTQVLAEISPHNAILNYEIGYDISGVVGQVMVRTMDVGKGSKIEVKKKNANKFSLGSKAKPLISSQSYVYIDSAIETQKDAESRAEYLLEDMSYRFGHIKMVLRGIPELVPGRFITLKGFGDGISNNFYITDVVHEFLGGKYYTTTIMGKASTL